MNEIFAGLTRPIDRQTHTAEGIPSRIMIQILLSIKKMQDALVASELDCHRLQARQIGPEIGNRRILGMAHKMLL